MTLEKTGETSLGGAKRTAAGIAGRGIEFTRRSERPPIPTNSAVIVGTYPANATGRPEVIPSSGFTGADRDCHSRIYLRGSTRPPGLALFGPDGWAESGK